MKFADLAAVEDIDRDEMTRCVGGDTSFGEFNSARIVAAGVGRAQLPGVLALEDHYDVDHLGQLIQAADDIGGGNPGNNGAKYFFSQTTVPDMKLPPGLV